MGMSSNVIGFKPPDDKWKKMKAVFDACKSGGIECPEEVEKFFEYKVPDKRGVEISQQDLRLCGAIRDHNADMEDGFELDLKKVPADVTIIRFYNSY